MNWVAATGALATLPEVTDTTIDTARDVALLLHVHVEPDNMVEEDIIVEEGIIVEEDIMTVVTIVVIAVVDDGTVGGGGKGSMTIISSNILPKSKTYELSYIPWCYYQQYSQQIQ